MTYNKAVFPRGIQLFCVLVSLYLLRRSYFMEELNCRTSEIAGASFTLSPMSDDFVEVIESTLSAVNTSKVWLETDDVSTTIRGKLIMCLMLQKQSVYKQQNQVNMSLFKRLIV